MEGAFVKKWLLLSFVLMACASKAPAPDVTYYEPLKEALMPVFPYGNYRHGVTVQMNGGKTFEFDGIAATSRQFFQLAVLSPLQVTMVKVKENRSSGDVRFEIFDERVARYKEKLADYYGLLRKLFVLERNGQSNEQLASGIALDRDAFVRFSQFARDIPHHVEIKEPKFNLKMEVESVDEANH